MIRFCSEMPESALVTSVHCVICHRFAQVGEFTIAPAASVYAGKPICFRCIDLAPVPARKAGPTELKTLSAIDVMEYELS